MRRTTAPSARTRLRPLAALAALLLSLLAANLIAVAPAHADTSGVNDWSCRPDAAHPEPVVLLHGLGSNKDQNWSFHGPRLAAAGYCVFSLTYGEGAYGPSVGGFAHVEDSAREIGGFIDEVLAATGAGEVDLVGHSEGGMQSLYVPKGLGYADKVDTVVALAPPTHGTTVAGLVTLGQVLGGQRLVNLFTDSARCHACTDLVAGSDFIEEFTATPIAQPGVDYTIIATRYDAVVTPPSSSFLREEGVTNYWVQDACPFDPVGHVGIAVDSGVTSMILNALDGRPIRCGFGLPF